MVDRPLPTVIVVRYTDPLADEIGNDPALGPSMRAALLQARQILALPDLYHPAMVAVARNVVESNATNLDDEILAALGIAPSGTAR